MLSKEKIDEILLAYNETKTYSGAAKKTGVSSTTVKKYVEEVKREKEIASRQKETAATSFLPFDEIKVPETEKERDRWLFLTEEEKMGLERICKELQ